MINENDIKDYSGDNYPQPAGQKFDSNKIPVHLFDPEFMEGVSRVLGFGAEKYAPNNWRGGIHYTRLIGAAYRHLNAINKGEDVDSESNLPHVYHLGCCVMFLASMMEHRKDLDDRYKPNMGRVKVTPYQSVDEPDYPPEGCFNGL